MKKIDFAKMAVTNEYTVKDGIENPQDGGGNCYECNSGDCDGGPCDCTDGDY
jgi:hypothetical protein